MEALSVSAHNQTSPSRRLATDERRLCFCSTPLLCVAEHFSSLAPLGFVLRRVSSVCFNNDAHSFGLFVYCVFCTCCVSF